MSRKPRQPLGDTPEPCPIDVPLRDCSPEQFETAMGTFVTIPLRDFSGWLKPAALKLRRELDQFNGIRED
jgi:hypothetical protein